jgi:hypothetical protein
MMPALVKGSEGMNRLAIVCLLVVLSCGAAACGGDEETAARPGEPTSPASSEPAGPDRGHVGRVSGTDAFIAVVAGGGEAVVYVCDGDAGIAEWFAGPVADEGSFDLTNDGGAGVRAAVVDDRYEGEVTFANGDQRPFSAVAAEEGAGLYRVMGSEAEAAGVDAGWIVDNDGEQRGSMRVQGVAHEAGSLPGEAVVVAGTSLPVMVFLVPRTPATPPGVPIPYPNTY